MQVEMLSQAHAEQAAMVESLSRQLERAHAERAALKQAPGHSEADWQRLGAERSAAQEAAAAALQRVSQLERDLQVCASTPLLTHATPC